MRKEGAKKSKLGLILVICLAAVLAVGGVLLAVLNGGSGQQSVADGPVKLYWNVDRDLYWGKSATGFSSREPDADGIYRIAFAVDGQLVKMPVADKTLVNAIDSLEVMVLTLDSDGNVIDVQDAKNVVKHSVIKSYVQDASGDTINANSAILMNGMRHRIKVTEKTKIYDMSGDAEFIGQEVKAESLSFLDCIHMFVNETTEEQTIFILSHMKEREMFFRAEQQWDFSNEETLRKPDADGVYSFECFLNEETVYLQTKDKDIADLIDYKNQYSGYFCFDFDENGYIVNIADVAAGNFGILACERLEITELNGNTFTAVGGGIIGNGSFSGTYDESCEIYDISLTARTDGCQGMKTDGLKLHDIVSVWVDTEGKPCRIVVTQRRPDSPAYWTFRNQYDSTKKETTRKPDSKGWYIFEMAETGENPGLRTFKTKDKAIANKIDSFYNRTVGLKLEGNVITGVYESDSLFGYASFHHGSAVFSINSVMVNMGGFANPQNQATIMMAYDCKVYDVSGYSTYGAETELQVGDHTYSHRGQTGEVVAIFVTQRSIGGDKLYYNLDYQYDEAKGETKRQPNADGYYEFLMAHNGKQVTIKTKDKKLANKIDGAAACMATIEAKNGIAKKAFNGDWSYNQYISTAYRVKSVKSDGTIVLYYGDNEITIQKTKDTKVYNVSYVYDKFRGEKTNTIKVGDMLGVIADMYGDVKVIYVRHRMVDDIFYRKTALTDPDGDGWYTGEFAVNGEVKTYKTQDPSIIYQVNNYSAPMGLALKDDVIRGYLVPTWVKGIEGTGHNSWDITKINGRKLTVKYTQVGHEMTGVSETMPLAKNCKIYDVSPTAGENYGKQTELRVGDRVRGYTDKNGNNVVVYVTYRANRDKGVTGYCDHCGQNVYWNPWVGGTWSANTGHYYLNTDTTVQSQASVGTKDKAYEIILDLNGKTFTVDNSRAFLINAKGTLTILDSVGGGAVEATGFTGAHGSVAMVDGKLNLLSGTLRMKESDQIVCTGGTMIFGPGTEFNMYGGVVENGKAQKGELSEGLGGNIYAIGATLNIYGGTIRGGSAAHTGGNIQLEGKAVLNLSGEARIEGGFAQAGGNICLYTGCTVNMTGGTVSGGETNYIEGPFGGGGNIYSVSAAVNISGGTVENGKAPNLQGGNIYVRYADSVLNLSGDAKIIGGEALYDGGSIVAFQNAALNITGGSVEGGVSGRNGGAIYAELAAVSVTGGTVKGGTAANGANIYINDATTTLHLGDVTVDGDFYLGKTTAVTVSGKPVIKKSAAGNGLSVMDGALLTLQQLQEGTEVYVFADGIFTAPTEQAEAYLQAGYFQPAATGTQIDQEGGALLVKEPVTMGYCEHCGQTVAWKVWTGEAGMTTGHYYLASDVNLSKQTSISAGTNVVLDLKGFDVTVTGTRAFLINSGAEMTVMDSVGEGVISATGFTGGHGGVAMVDGKLTLLGGTLKMLESDAVICNGGTLILGAPTAVLDMYDGVIEGGYAQKGELSNGFGGNIYSYGATINLYGGTIRGGKATTYGGNIYCANASKVNLYGGVIEGGITNGNDGNIFILNDQATFLLGDVTIDGGVYVGQAVITVNGKPVIKKDTANGLTLDYGAKLDIQDMKEGAEVYMNASGVISNPTALADQIITAKYIKSVREDLAVYKDETGALKIAAAEPNCDHCSQFVTWNAWDGTGNLETGHYYLTGDVTRESQITIPADNDVVLDLKGFDITAPASRAFLVQGNLTVMDSVGDGVVSATGVTGGHGGVASVDGSLTLYGGTLKMLESDAVICNGGVLIFSPGTVFDMRGGVIEGGKAQKGDLSDGMGGNIYASGATLNISGGTIRGGSAAYVGGNIAMEGNTCTLAVSGDAVIEGGSAQAGGNVSLFTATTLNMTGGSIRNGQSNYSSAALGGGGNIFAASAVVNISAGTVENGTAPTLQGGNIFMRYADSVLNLSGTGKISGGSCKYDGGSIVVFQNAVMNMTGGTVENGTAGRNGGNIIVESATLTVTGGKISGGKASGHGGNIVALGTVNLQGGTVTGGVVDNTTGSFGGNIYAEGASGIVNISGDAAVTDGKAPAGGNIGSYQGTITMTGGTVSGGESTYTTGSYGGGGNFYLFHATANISGGTVEGGKAPTLEAGNFYVRGGSAALTVSGTAQITGGEAKYDGGNILVFQGATLNVQGGTISGGTAGRNAPCVFLSTSAIGNFTGGVVDAVYKAADAGTMSVSGSADIKSLTEA